METTFVIGKEYEFSAGTFVKLEKIVGTTAVVRDRWDAQFDVELSQLKEKKPRIMVNRQDGKVFAGE